MFGRIGPMELVLVLTIALIIFGPSKLPEIGKSIGKAITEFKSQASSIAKDVDISNLDEPEKKQQDSPARGENSAAGQENAQTKRS